MNTSEKLQYVEVMIRDTQDRILRTRKQATTYRDRLHFLQSIRADLVQTIEGKG